MCQNDNIKYKKTKNYESIVEVDHEAEIFHGEVINIRDVITFQGSSVEELKQAFQDSIDNQNNLIF